MRGLHDIVGTLAALRIARETTTDAQCGEVLTTGEDLVHVRLVPGVEDEGIVRRGEHAVQRDRQLDDAQVGTEVTARARDVLDEERADLRSEFGELIGGQRVQITGS